MESRTTVVFDFKVSVMDLDMTLWNGKKLYVDIHSILSTLKKDGIKLYVASFHTEARKCCEKLGIAHYFEDILYGRDRTKLQMIKEIMGKHPGVAENEVAFFDDNFNNIMEVKLSGMDIKAVHIDSNGLSWLFIPSRFISGRTSCTQSFYLQRSVYDVYDDYFLDDRHRAKLQFSYDC